MTLKLSGPDKQFIPSILFGNRLTDNPIYYTNYIGFLTFNNDFNQPISKQIIDIIKTNKNIQFGFAFNQPVKNLPNTIEKLFFDCKFNQPLDLLPEGIKSLGVGRDFNQSLYSLPKSIISIEYRSTFDLDLTILPIQLKRLIILNSNIDSDYDCLPDDLEHLSLPDEFNCELKKLPSNLKILKLGNKFNKPIDLIQKLNSFGKESLEMIVFSEYSKFSQPIVRLSSNLKVLIFGDEFSQELNCLPIGLKVLRLGKKFNYPLDNLPCSLDELVIGSSLFNHPINNLPDGLTKLYFKNDCEFNYPLEKLPENLQHLKLNSKYSYDLDNLPNKLKSMVISDCGVICRGLNNKHHLKIFYSYNKQIAKSINKLEYLVLEKKYEDEINEILLSIEYKIANGLIIRVGSLIYCNEMYILNFKIKNIDFEKITNLIYKIEIKKDNYYKCLPCYNYVPDIDNFLQDYNVLGYFDTNDFIVGFCIHDD